MTPVGAGADAPMPAPGSSTADAVTGATPAHTKTGPMAVSMRGITKRFAGGVVANDGVDLDVAPGEVHALLGENGAGKSTLSNVLTGLYRQDEGTVSLFGKPVSFSSPKDAIAAGVAMVHQHFRLVTKFTVAENFLLGSGGSFDAKNAAERITALGKEYGLEVDPNANVWELSVGEQQRVEILKALDRRAKILILDEPTAVLTPQEADALFATMRRMTEDGRSVIFISHKLHEVMKVSDRVTTLRDGRTVGTVVTKDVTSADLARQMVGRSVVFSEDDVEDRPEVDPSRLVLDVLGLSAVGVRPQSSPKSVDLQVKAGEIVAICGVSGNGQRELAASIYGLLKRTSGTVKVNGVESKQKGPRESTALGLAFIPEDRLKTGLSASLPIKSNLALKGYRFAPMSSGPFLKHKVIKANAEEKVKRYGIKCPGIDTPTRVLSGGNVQKVLLAREIGANPHILIASTPTRGLDVGAIETVRSLLMEAARNGTGVLLITEDLDEAMALAHRLVVMFEGRIAGEFHRGDFNIEKIGLLMGGHSGEDGAA
ncbi:ABC transporter ATP-binding protein [Propioniciclava tarda]|nr:ABC transporter ATP-binding protein [Propioniciclava tarda]